MASYYPEGECYFQRNSLRYSRTFTAENTDHFYRHVLLEYYWNGWPATGVQSRSHVRSNWRHGTPSGIGGTRFGDWDRFWVAESREKVPTQMLRIHNHANSLNWNECRDHQRGGPRKYILRPVRIESPETQWLWIDATIPLRAIYFPVSQSTDEALKELCTYVVIDLRHRRQLRLRHHTNSLLEINFPITSYNGLGWNDAVSWGFHIPNIIAYLSIPHKLRNPDYDLFMPNVRGEEMVVWANATTTWRSPSIILQYGDFFREMDFAVIISATFGVEVGWRPFEYSSFLQNLLVSITQMALGFVPVIGPILSIAFGMGIQLLTDPDSFGRDNILELGIGILETVIDAGKRSQKYIAPDFLAQCPCGGQQRGAPLTDEQREQRKKLGEEINKRLTEGFKPKVVFRSLLEQEKLFTGHIEEIKDEATETTQDAEPGEEPEEKQETQEQEIKDGAEENGEKHD
ncbi:hypothetical protein H9Q72_012246 [Fusarium xylarioides]|uniref:Uncharacterized protein n=1 Tax=Fusarium xylarioides TaxID=221167 RepID=A0A9P7HHB4_9HYPO|nr:hypothetical protein H9Q72_012246 [Fusarium xylarioides]